MAGTFDWNAYRTSVAALIAAPGAGEGSAQAQLLEIARKVNECRATVISVQKQVRKVEIDPTPEIEKLLEKAVALYNRMSEGLLAACAEESCSPEEALSRAPSMKLQKQFEKLSSEITGKLEEAVAKEKARHERERQELEDATVWFYLNSSNENEQGDFESLVIMVKKQTLHHQSWVWREGWDDWRKLGEVDEFAMLFNDLASAPPPLPEGSLRRTGTTVLLGGMEFVWCPPGHFIMGCREDEIGSGDNSAQGEVVLTRGFWLGKFPVTQSQWEAVIGRNPSQFASSGPDAPVEQVSWEEANEYCQRLSLVHGQQFRLPTEAEWEYGCRAGSTRAWGFLQEDYSDADIEMDSNDALKVPEYAWVAENSEGRTHPVGLKKPNAWGLHDMHGNVDEWCHDYYERYYSFGQVTPEGSIVDPTGPSHGSERAFRGGGWNSSDEYNRSASRWGADPHTKDGNLGFRIVADEGKVAPPVLPATVPRANS